MTIMKKIVSGSLVIAACAVFGAAQTAGDKGAPPTSSQTRSSDLTDYPKDWQVYNLGSKGGFRVALPKKPEIESENMKSGDTTLKVSYFTASSEDILTVIADIHDLPIGTDRFSEENKTYLFKKVREGLVEGMKTALEKNGLNPEIKFYAQKNITLRGVSGYEQDLSVGPLKGKTRMLSSKDHIYIFFTLLLNESRESLMSNFLDSFEFSGVR